MVTLQEIELLAGLLARAGVTQIEAIWANMILERLRALAIELDRSKPNLKTAEEAPKDRKTH